MFLLKQLQPLNVNGVRKFGIAVHHIVNVNRIGFVPLTNSIQLQTQNGVRVLNESGPKTPDFIVIRNYYRNYQHHPSRIVRAYRKTRTWLTDHFVLSEKRFENIYSFSFIVGMGLLFIAVGMLNLHLHGETGSLDKNTLPQNKDSSKK